VHAVQLGFAAATKTVVIGMAGAMAAAFVVALIWMPRGRPDQEPVVDAAEAPGAGEAAAGPVARTG
jgi:hypothetical protein